MLENLSIISIRIEDVNVNQTRFQPSECIVNEYNRFFDQNNHSNLKRLKFQKYKTALLFIFSHSIRLKLWVEVGTD